LFAVRSYSAQKPTDKTVSRKYVKNPATVYTSLLFFIQTNCQALLAENCPSEPRFLETQSIIKGSG
jgi:hypothetical protein